MAPLITPAGELSRCNRCAPRHAVFSRCVVFTATLGRFPRMFPGVSDAARPVNTIVDVHTAPSENTERGHVMHAAVGGVDLAVVSAVDPAFPDKPTLYAGPVRGPVAVVPCVVTVIASPAHRCRCFRTMRYCVGVTHA